MRRSQLKFALVAASIGVSASAFAQTGTIYKPAWSVSSGSVAAATATCTLPAATVPPAGATAAAWIVTGFEIVGTGATGASTILATLSNMQPGGTLTYPVGIPAGVTTQVNQTFSFPGGLLSQPGVAVVLTVPSFGAGNTNAACNLHGVPY